MKDSKRKKLEAAGWKVGSASEFLDLDTAEEVLVNMKLSLATRVRDLRLDLKLTQEELAKKIGSSQSRIAKMEAADGTVSIELLIRSLATLGESQKAIGKTVGAKSVAKKNRSRGKKQIVKK